jgi:hypothetical protein
MKENKRWLLILGGTNFMGKLLLHQLATNYKVCCINRGKIYWYNYIYKGTTKPGSSILRFNGFVQIAMNIRITSQQFDLQANI